MSDLFYLISIGSAFTAAALVQSLPRATMDRELEHIVNEVGITGSGRRALVTYEIGR